MHHTPRMAESQSTTDLEKVGFDQHGLYRLRLSMNEFLLWVAIVSIKCEVLQKVLLRIFRYKNLLEKPVYFEELSRVDVVERKRLLKYIYYHH